MLEKQEMIAYLDSGLLEGGGRRERRLVRLHQQLPLHRRQRRRLAAAQRLQGRCRQATVAVFSVAFPTRGHSGQVFGGRRQGDRREDKGGDGQAVVGAELAEESFGMAVLRDRGGGETEMHKKRIMNQEDSWIIS